jgi:hypothetical protein
LPSAPSAEKKRGIHYLSGLKSTNMSDKIKNITAGAPPVPGAIHGILVWLENNVRKPLEGTAFDKWVAKPAKQYYITTKRLE